jgi:hypothetical protein
MGVGGEGWVGMPAAGLWCPQSPKSWHLTGLNEHKAIGSGCLTFLKSLVACRPSPRPARARHHGAHRRVPVSGTSQAMGNHAGSTEERVASDIPDVSCQARSHRPRRLHGATPGLCKSRRAPFSHQTRLTSLLVFKAYPLSLLLLLRSSYPPARPWPSSTAPM